MHTPAPLVLIADNDIDVGELLSEVLRLRGVRTEWVGDGAQALQRIREGGIDALVCDLDMPVLDGEALLRELEGLPGAPPVLVVSGYIDGAIQERLRCSRHLRGVMRKPFDVMVFAERVAEVAAAAPAGGQAMVF